jgi:hypothetical protein
MMDVKIRATNKDQVLKIYTDESGFHIPSMALKALNMTAVQVKEALVQNMRSTFDRPTPYTLNAPYVKFAKAKDLKAQILLREFGGKSRSEQYLLVQTYGGDRRIKSFESALRAARVLPDGMYAVPGQRAPLDAYGNISAGFIVQMLSYFKAFGQQGYRANITDKKKAAMAKGTKKKRGVTYFAIHEPRRGLRPGIYRQTAFAFGNSVEPMMIFVRKPAYKKLLQWDEIAKRTIDENFKENLKLSGMEI